MLFSLLSKAVRDRYGYDPDAAKSFKKEQAKKHKKYRNQKELEQMVEYEQSDIYRQSRGHYYYDPWIKEAVHFSKAPPMVQITGTIFQALTDRGITLVRISSGSLVALTDYKGGGGNIVEVCKPIGSFQYNTVDGGVNVVPKYQCVTINLEKHYAFKKEIHKDWEWRQNQKREQQIEENVKKIRSARKGWLRKRSGKIF